MDNENGLIRREDRVNYVVEKFKVEDTINQLNRMMVNVTSREMNAQNVNAACNCVARLNETIDTAIKAAKFLGGMK